MSRHIFSPEETRAAGRISGRRSRENKTGMFSLSPEQRRQNSSLGGKIQGPITGAANVASGQLDRIRELPQTKAAQSAVGKRTGRALGLKYGPLSDMSRIKTPDSLKLGGQNSTGRHVRHHVNRRLFNPLCSLCMEAKANGDIFWTAIYYPKDPRSWTGPRGKKKELIAVGGSVTDGR